MIRYLSRLFLISCIVLGFHGVTSAILERSTAHVVCSIGSIVFGVLYVLLALFEKKGTDREKH